ERARAPRRHDPRRSLRRRLEEALVDPPPRPGASARRRPRARARAPPALREVPAVLRRAAVRAGARRRRDGGARMVGEEVGEGATLAYLSRARASAAGRGSRRPGTPSYGSSRSRRSGSWQRAAPVVPAFGVATPRCLIWRALVGGDGATNSGTTIGPA